MDESGLAVGCSTGFPFHVTLAAERIAYDFSEQFKHIPPGGAGILAYNQVVVLHGATTSPFVKTAPNIWASVNPHHDDTTFHIINDLGEAGYSILKPIPVDIKTIGPADYEASFKEANIAICGNSTQDAYQALVATILDTFDALHAEPRLSSKATEQLRILHTYIDKR